MYSVSLAAPASHRFQIFEEDDAGSIRESNLSCESGEGKLVVFVVRLQLPTGSRFSNRTILEVSEEIICCVSRKKGSLLWFRKFNIPYGDLFGIWRFGPFSVSVRSRSFYFCIEALFDFRKGR